MIFDPFLLSDLSFSTYRILDITMNNPASGTLVPSIDGPLKKGFFFLIRLAWESRIRIPYIIAIAFMALDIRMQLEITVDRAVRQIPDGNEIAALNMPEGVLYDDDDDEDVDGDDEDDNDGPQYDSSINSSLESTTGDSEVEERIVDLEIENVIDKNDNTDENNVLINVENQAVADSSGPSEGEGSKRNDNESTENVGKNSGENCQGTS